MEKVIGASTSIVLFIIIIFVIQLLNRLLIKIRYSKCHKKIIEFCDLRLSEKISNFIKNKLKNLYVKNEYLVLKENFGFCMYMIVAVFFTIFLMIGSYSLFNKETKDSSYAKTLNDKFDGYKIKKDDNSEYIVDSYGKTAKFEEYIKIIKNKDFSMQNLGSLTVKIDSLKQFDITEFYMSYDNLFRLIEEKDNKYYLLRFRPLHKMLRKYIIEYDTLTDSTPTYRIHRHLKDRQKLYEKITETLHLYIWPTKEEAIIKDLLKYYDNKNIYQDIYFALITEKNKYEALIPIIQKNISNNDGTEESNKKLVENLTQVLQNLSTLITVLIFLSLFYYINVFISTYVEAKKTKQYDDVIDRFEKEEALLNTLPLIYSSYKEKIENIIIVNHNKFDMQSMTLIRVGIIGTFAGILIAFNDMQEESQHNQEVLSSSVM